MLLLLPWTLVTEGVPSWQRWPRVLAVIFTLGALAASGARVAAVFGTVWAIWALAKRSALSPRARTVGSIAVILTVVAAGLFFARVEILGSTSTATLGKRPGMARVVAAAVALRPAMGWGPDGFLAGGSAASTPQLAEGGSIVAIAPGASDPHSLLLTVVVSTGLIGLGLFVWFGAETFVRWRSLLREVVDASTSIWAVCGALVVFLTAPASPLVLPLFALVFGVSLSGRGNAAGAGTGDRPVPQLAVTASLMVIAFTSGVLALNAGTRATFEIANDERAPKVATSALRMARLWGVDPHLWYLASQQIGYVLAENPAAFGGRPDAEALAHAVALDTRNPFYPLELAWVQRVYGEPAAAIEPTYQEAIRRYPLDPRAHAEYAGYLAQLGRMADAEAQLRVAAVLIERDPEDTVAAQQAVREARETIAAAPR